MKKFVSFRIDVFLVFFAILFSFFGSAHSAENSPSPSFLIHPWAVGQSISLQTKNFHDGNLIQVENITYSIVAEETIGDKPYFWMEIEKAESSGVTIFKKIQVRQPGGIDFENVLGGNLSILKSRRRIQKVTLGSAKRHSSLSEFEISTEAVSQIENNPAPSAIEDLTGQYVVTSDQGIGVPAGSFKTSKFSRLPPISNPTPAATPVSAPGGMSFSRSLDAWGSPEVPIWGLVKKISKTTAPDHSEFIQQTELLSYKTSGSVSKINETPKIVPLELQKKLSRNFSNQYSDLSTTEEQP